MAKMIQNGRLKQQTKSLTSSVVSTHVWVYKVLSMKKNDNPVSVFECCEEESE